MQVSWFPFVYKPKKRNLSTHGSFVKTGMRDCWLLQIRRAENLPTDTNFAVSPTIHGETPEMRTWRVYLLG
jgi:hypothetical protein